MLDGRVVRIRYGALRLCGGDGGGDGGMDQTNFHWSLIMEPTLQTLFVRYKGTLLEQVQRTRERIVIPVVQVEGIYDTERRAGCAL